MGMQGNLKDMTIADLIQHNCQDRKTAQLRVQHHDEEAILYFKEGRVVHAMLGQQIGEEVIYHILNWEEGNFNLENNIAPPQTSITSSWSALLMEGARRLDENALNLEPLQNESNQKTEANPMEVKMSDILKEMSGEITGYLASVVVGMDGIDLATHSHTKGLDLDMVGAQMTMLFKLVEGSVEKLGSGEIEDNLTTTDNAYLLMHFLPGSKQYYLGVAVDRKTGNLGNLRLISKMYAEHLSKAMPG
jgi:predicted regulator of Ras-like GTPase activity (Roadblock/LC7/MglB family)